MSSSGAAAAGPTHEHLVETTITADRGWFDWRLKQLWRYRDLLMMLVWRDFVSAYKQTILGPLWHLLKPLITTATFTVVFYRLAGLSTDGVSPFLFYMVGNVVWAYFSNCLDNVAKTLIGNATLMGKVYFHRLVIPLSLILSNLVAFGIQLAILVAVMIGHALTGAGVHVTGWLLAAPLLLLILAGLGLGGGLLVCAATTRYRDFNHLVAFGIQLLMYLSPVIYPLSTVPPGYQAAARLNPIAPLLEAFRKGFLGVGTVAPADVAYSFVVMLVLLVAGLTAYTRMERTFLDTA